MNKQIRNINNKPAINGFENDLMDDNSDSALFETISQYMKGRLDLEEVKNDPAFSGTREAVKEMICDYNKNVSENKENKKFIRDVFSGAGSEEKLNEEIKFIKQEINDNKLNDITTEWVKEWHEKKQKIGLRDPKTEEIRDFITGAINNTESKPVKILNDESKKSSGRSLFVRYISLSAAALISVFILIRALLPSSNPEKLFSSYYKPFEALSTVTRSLDNSETNNYSSAIENYKTGKYHQAAIGFANTLQKDPSFLSAQFFLGLSNLALGNYDQAINMLAGVTNTSGDYGKEARWYLGLTYLKTADKQKAAECFKYLAGSDGFYRERSEKILRSLK
jgi:tetratricopeptide (TPR) repeat protein